MEFQNKEEAGCASTRWLCLPVIFSSSSKHLETRSPTCSAGPTAGRFVLCSAPQGEETLLYPAPLWLREPACASGGPAQGVLAPPFFGSTQTIVLDKLIPTTPQTPGSLWWAEGTDGSPGRPPGQLPSLGLWVGPSLGTLPHPQPRSRSWDTGGSVPFKEKAFGTLPTVQTFLNPTPYPCPHPVPSPPSPRTPTCPAPPSSTSPGLPVQLWAGSQRT